MPIESKPMLRFGDYPHPMDKVESFPGGRPQNVCRACGAKDVVLEGKHCFGGCGKGKRRGE